jgi:hypothetical protein
MKKKFDEKFTNTLMLGVGIGYTFGILTTFLALELCG